LIVQKTLTLITRQW